MKSGNIKSLWLWPVLGVFVFFVPGIFFAHGPGASMLFMLLGVAIATIVPLMNYLLYLCLKKKTRDALAWSAILAVFVLVGFFFILVLGGLFDFF